MKSRHSSPPSTRGREARRHDKALPSEPCPSPPPSCSRRTRQADNKKRKSVRTNRVCISSHEVVSDCESSARQTEPPAMGRTSPTLRRAWPKDGPLAAICVQSVDVQCVLQFTLIHAAGCVLHRRTSRVIHRLKLFSFFLCFSSNRRRQKAWRARRGIAVAKAFDKLVSSTCVNDKRRRKNSPGAAPVHEDDGTL